MHPIHPTPRPSARQHNELRTITLETGVNDYAEGSCLICFGGTKVMCTASVQGGVPRWAKGAGHGWITAEYGMIPRATHERVDREATKGKQSGRTLEISRLIGRSVRSVIDLTALGDRTIWLDCDVIQADGGTRTAAVTGAFVALHIALQGLQEKGKLKHWPVREFVAAVSSGVTASGTVLDLDYVEDCNAIADGNYVMTESGGLVEVQATSERTPIARAQFDEMLALAQSGIADLIALQKQAVGL